VAAAVIIVVATVVGVVAPVREAVASWFGIGSTGVERVDEGDGRGDPGDLPFLSTYLAPIDRATAEQELGAQLPVPERLGPPPVLGTPPEGGVVMAWADGATTLWVQRNRQRPAEMVSKLLTVDDRFERIDDLGEDAAVVEGAHVLETPLRRLAAGTVLIWLDDGFEYRLESDLGVDEMTAIAHEISPG
jgi:hypothetical protein